MSRAGLIFSLLLLSLLLNSTGLAAAEIRVAVASNFAEAIKQISKAFEAKTRHKVTLIYGSTGKHFAQISQGAPFDLFLAADIRRPRLLEEQGLALAGSRFTYAKGKLVLWSSNPDLVDSAGQILKRGSYRYLAIANPKLAPYGRAARELLENLGIWDSLKSRLVRGENIGQTFQFAGSGNAELGLVAYSQLQRPGEDMGGSHWLVPQSLYTPIEQQAVLLREGRTAREFWTFLASEESREIIHSFGYAE